MKIKALSMLSILCVYWFNAQNTNAQQEEPTVYQVGVAAVDVTPDFPIRLRGYSGRDTESTGVVQKLWAKALMIQSPQRPPALLITLDNCLELGNVCWKTNLLEFSFRIPMGEGGRSREGWRWREVPSCVVR